MPNFVELFELRHAHLLATFERPLASVEHAFEFGMLAHDHQRFNMPACQHRAEYLPIAKQGRDRYLLNFGRAHAARGILYMLTHELPDRETATSMIVDMLAGITGQQPEPQTVISMLAALTGDRIGIASGFWKPANISVSSLALACQKLNITTKRFAPIPGQFHAACVEAHAVLKRAEEGASTFVDRLRSYDAVLLDFDREEWERPYLTGQSAAMLRCMLDLHYHEGYGSADDVDGRHPFQQKVLAERARLGDAADSPPVLTSPQDDRG